MTISRSSALSICTLLISEMQLINGALFLNATLLFLPALFGSITVISPFTTIFASLKSHKSALLILISLLTL